MKSKHSIPTVFALTFLFFSSCASLPSFVGLGPSSEKKEEAIKQLLERRVEFDLGCPLNQTKIVKITNSTFGAVGCSKKASYMAIGDSEHTCFDYSTLEYIERECKIILEGVQKL